MTARNENVKGFTLLFFFLIPSPFKILLFLIFQSHSNGRSKDDHSPFGLLQSFKEEKKERRGEWK